MSKKDGGPAFPIGSGDMRDPQGMSLRDYFAGLAMQGMLANKDIDFPDVPDESLPTLSAVYAKHATACADALLAELNKERER